MGLFTPINGWTKETIISHIETEFKGRSYQPETGCVYLGQDGKKCAVGLFIPDTFSLFTSGGENINSGYNVARLLQAFPNLAQHMPLGTDALQTLQTIHDFSIPSSDTRTDDQVKAELIDWVRENVA